MLFLAVDKKTHQIGLFDCSDAFYASGERKVKEACAIYEKFYGDDSVDFDKYILSDTL